MMVLKGFPNGITWGQQYDVGEKPTVTLYTYINHRVGTPKQNQTCYYTVFLDYKSSRLRYIIIQYFWTKSSRLRYSNIL